VYVHPLKPRHPRLRCHHRSRLRGHCHLPLTSTPMQAGVAHKLSWDLFRWLHLAFDATVVQAVRARTGPARCDGTLPISILVRSLALGAVLTDDHAFMPRLRPRIPDGGCLRARIVCCRTPHRAPSTKCPRQRPLSSAHTSSHSSFTPLADCSASLAGLTSCQQRDVNELAAGDVFWLTRIRPGGLRHRAR